MSGSADIAVAHESCPLSIALRGSPARVPHRTSFHPRGGDAGAQLEGRWRPW